MARLRRNFTSGTITDNPLTSGATTINSANFANLPTVASPDIVAIVLDPLGTAGAPEIAYVTAHTAAATSGTVLRGQETALGGSAARQHAQGIPWILSDTAGGEQAGGQWVDFTPILWQGGTVTKNINYARHFRYGRLITVEVNLAVTGTGTASTDVHIGLPVTGATPTGTVIGAGTIYNASNFASYPGLAEIITSGTEIQLRNTGASGIQVLGSSDFTDAFANGDGVTYFASYEAAS